MNYRGRFYIRRSSSVVDGASAFERRRIGALIACVLLSVLLPVLTLSTLAGCGQTQAVDEDTPLIPPEPPGVDLAEIQERGTLRAITSYGPLSYFQYRGRPLGFEYELAERLADTLGVELEIIPAADIGEMQEFLHHGHGDIIAYRLTITAERGRTLAFTTPVTSTRHVLVQPDPGDRRDAPDSQTEARNDPSAHAPEQRRDTSFVQRPEELAGREVHVRKGSVYVSRLQELQAEMDIPIEIVEADPEVTTEQLIEAVHDGEIPLTVADEEIAQILSSHYDRVDIETVLTPPQPTAWAVRPESEGLLGAVDQWLTEERRHADFHVIYNRYFRAPRDFRSRISDDAFTVRGGSISPYDEIFRREARRLDWDWRLLAALAYQESRFNPNARSWVGAVGVMQLMPATARQFGVARRTDPEQSIAGGVRFLAWLQSFWEERVPDPDERLRFILASYNVGHGHVQDAQRLAEYFGHDATSWDDVSTFLRKKSDPQYYLHDVVRNGYARGSEPVAYVSSILRLYRHYERLAETWHPNFTQR